MAKKKVVKKKVKTEEKNCAVEILTSILKPLNKAAQKHGADYVMYVLLRFSSSELLDMGFCPHKVHELVEEAVDAAAYR
jgi:hypothetical protein